MAFYVFTLLGVAFLLNLLRIRYSRGLNQFPGPFLASFTDLWKVWYAYHNSQKANDIYYDIHEKYGDVVRIGPNNLSFADPKAIYEIYGTKGSNQKSMMYDVTAMPVKGVRNKLLLSARDERWHDQQRRLINSAFTLSSILKYEPWVNDTIGVFLRQMKERFVEKGGSEGIIDLQEWCSFFTADVISNLTYGERTGFMETGTDINGIQKKVRLIWRPWLYFTRMPLLDRLTLKNPLFMWLCRQGIVELKDPLSPLVKSSFDARKQVWEKGEKETASSGRETLTDRFLTVAKENPDNTEYDPEKHARSMVIAGSETTAITLSSVIYFLLKHPKCYEKLQQEIDAVPSEELEKTPNGLIFSWEKAQTLPYLEACIREAMRIHVVQRMPHDRVAPPTGMQICGRFVPSGTDVGIYAPVLHRRKAVFGDDVNEYRPERWLDDSDSDSDSNPDADGGGGQRVSRMRNSMFTFSYGKYNCLGKNISRMEMYKFLPSVLRTYEVSLDDPDSEWTLLPGAFAVPSQVYVRMKRR